MKSEAGKGGKILQVVLSQGERPLRILMEKDVPESGRLLVAIKSGAEAHDSAQDRHRDATLLDLEIPDLGRAEVYRSRGHEDGSEAQILMITAQSEFQSIAEALEPEAFDFLTKPLDPEELARLVEQVETASKASSGGGFMADLRRRLDKTSVKAPILAESPAMEQLLRLADRVAASTATVLIHGETGSGKGMIARLIHELSPRIEERFVAINCSAFQDHLLESELFGHEKGSFTGAFAAKQGLFEVADKGTLFLDEVAEMTPSMQAKLLQVLDLGEIRRVGGTNLRRIQTRIVAASNKDLRKEVREGRFREDLLFRLNVVTLRVPPLRERSEEIPGLVAGFLERFEARGLATKRFSREAMGLLQAYGWPGNVRELSNTIEGLLLLTQNDLIRVEDLPQPLRLVQPAPSDSASPITSQPPEEPVPLTEVERVHVARVLRYTQGKKAPAARLLGIDVKTLNKKIRAYEIQLPR
jgi:DNA-binding NtrC family response regulator